MYQRFCDCCSLRVELKPLFSHQGCTKKTEVRLICRAVPLGRGRRQALQQRAHAIRGMDAIEIYYRRRIGASDMAEGQRRILVLEDDRETAQQLVDSFS